MPDTPSGKYGIQRPADVDHIRDWPSIMRTAIDELDGLIVAFSVADPRPAAGKSGRLHRHPTTGVISYDDGASWHEMTTQPHAARHAEGGDDPVLGQLPIGAVIAYAGSVLPSGGAFAWADGSLVDKTTFATLFGRVGHTYNGGVDPGSNKMRLPDKRGRALAGADNYGVGAASRMGTARGAGAGANTHSHTVNAHSHTVNSHSHPLIFSGGPSSVQNIEYAGGGAVLTLASSSHGHGFPGPTGNTAPGTDAPTPGTNAINHLPPHEADNVIVRIA
jgi:microcystin-dependent protein